MSEFSQAALERILRKANAQRISAKALEELGDALDEYGLRVAREAVDLARHAGRVTVKREDVKLAVRRL